MQLFFAGPPPPPPVHFLSFVDGEGRAPVVVILFHLLSWVGSKVSVILPVLAWMGRVPACWPEAAGQCFYCVTWGLVLNLSEAQA